MLQKKGTLEWAFALTFLLPLRRKSRKQTPFRLPLSMQTVRQSASTSLIRKIGSAKFDMERFLLPPVSRESSRGLSSRINFQYLDVRIPILMKMTRRLFAFTLLFAPIVFSFAGGSASKPAANRKYLVFVGTYTNKTESKGIYAYDFDADTGKLTPKGVAAETPDPSWVAVHPSGKYLYAANEAGKASTVSAFALNVTSGKLTLLNQMPSLGEDPCYLSFDKTGRYVLNANYSSGQIAVFPILADGRLGENTALLTDQGATGPNKEHQKGPHAHWIETSPDNRFVLVADLGLDEVLVYKFDATSGVLTPNEPAFARLKAGSGPRHAVFHPNGKFIFAVSELSSTATSFAYDVKKGTLKETGTASTLPPGFSGRNDVAEAAVHPNGKFLYVSNRGTESIAF